MKPLRFIRKNLVLVLFFVFLGIALFLGDGKQVFVEVFLAGGIVFLYALFFIQKRKIKPLPSTIFILWFLIITYFIVRTVFSDSVGYSVSATIRLIEGFLVYQLFYSLRDKNIPKYFSCGLKLLTIFAIAAAVIFTVQPALVRFLSSMNLLYSTYGHNHLVDFLLFVVPLSFWSLDKNCFWSKVFISTVLLGVIISFSRGAWFVILGYAFFYLIKNKYYSQLKVVVLVLLALICGWLILDKIIFSTKISNGSIPTAYFWLRRQVVKPPPWQDPRLGYWRQALAAFSERPWFGSGPGTFYLESKRLQPTPDSYSWFAHSLPLETLVELGILGSIPLWLLIWIQIQAFWRGLKKRPERKSDIYFEPLFTGLVLTLVYGLFEYNLNYLIVWLIFWGICGLLMGEAQYHPPGHGIGRTILTCLFVLIVFDLASVLGLVASGVFQNNKLAFYLTPFDSNQAIGYLHDLEQKKSPATAEDFYLIKLFHQNNPDVMTIVAEIGNDFPQKAINQTGIFENNVFWDPLNFQTHKNYLRYLIDNKQVSGIGKELRSVSARLFPKERQNLESLPFNNPSIYSLYTKPNLKPFLETFDPHVGLAKTYYNLGWSSLPNNPKLTERLWTEATYFAPGWSYFYIELAALEKYVIKHNDLAILTLDRCLLVKDAKKHCEIIKQKAIPYPGVFYENIQAIPRVLR